ncbi:hypothetical protein BDZ90DRAFT_234788 [Jaminaea rosea]|uniref:Ca3427-like PBP 2 domain-containing protein n=1 Tax=Jaminaea rosea TaxID=1569628 RepID=A0A316UIU4_9BASI|nr:hypothetical protein BDZ90DRAFT_234788 [Jaminaea rosea]PWN24844.1 hypothetical protein BDZ90DRAFT_234788 [Jaminaea rosea]
MSAPTSGKLRIGYIPEHFASPLLLLARSPWGQDHITLVPCPSGTGQILTSFRDGSIDVAIALTEALVAGIAKRAAGEEVDLKLVGSYVRSSLVWAVITGKETKAYGSIEDLAGTTLGISRAGSGSQIMGSVMALQRGWTAGNGKAPSFSIQDSFQGLRDSVNAGSTSAFMWETFTTKPYFDSGEVRKIGEVPTPWPSWSIAATRRDAALDSFLEKLEGSIHDFTSASSFAAGTPRSFIVQELGYQPEDVDAWLDKVRWAGDQRPNHASNTVIVGQETSTRTVSRQALVETVKVLREAGVLGEEEEKRAKDPSEIVDPWGNGREGRLVE